MGHGCLGPERSWSASSSDITTKCGLTKTWENVWDIVARYPKQRQWLGDEEKQTTELMLRPRFIANDCQTWGQESITEKGIDTTTVEQLLKEMENLKIFIVLKSEVCPTNSKYKNRRCI